MINGLINEEEQTISSADGDYTFYSMEEVLNEANRLLKKGQYTEACNFFETAGVIFEEEFNSDELQEIYFDFLKLKLFDKHEKNRDYNSMIGSLNYYDGFKNYEYYIYGLAKLPGGYLPEVVLSKETAYPILDETMRISRIENQEENERIKAKINEEIYYDLSTHEFLESIEVETYIVDMETQSYKIYLTKQPSGGIKTYAIEEMNYD